VSVDITPYLNLDYWLQRNDVVCRDGIGNEVKIKDLPLIASVRLKVCGICKTSLTKCHCGAPVEQLAIVWDLQGFREKTIATILENAQKSPTKTVEPAPALMEKSAEEEKPTEGFAGFEVIALHNASLGYLVFPVDSGKKKASIKKFPELATRDTDQIKSWAKRFPKASCGLLATHEGHLFTDEDDSQSFRDGYTAFSGEPFPVSRTTESRPNHRQGHWLQTDYSRKMLRNITQDKTKDKMFSLRFHNYLVLGEGSQHPSGLLYRVVVDSPAIPMPDKLVDYIRSLIVDGREDLTQPATPMVSAPASADGDTQIPPQFNVMLTEPGRNDGVSRYAWHVWQNETTDRDEFSAKVRTYNDEHCQPPLSDVEVDAIINGKLDKPVTGVNAVLSGGVKAGTNPAVSKNKPTAVPQDSPAVSENMRETSLLVFKNQEAAKAAISWGLNAVAAEKFKASLDFAFRRVVYIGDDRDPSYRKVYAAMNGRGVVSVKAPKTLSAESLEKILGWEAITSLSITNPKMVWTSDNSLGQKAGYALEFKYAAVPNPAFDFILDKALGASEGWFPLGDPSLIAAPSGGSKTTFIVDLLESQRKKENFLGHATFGLPYLVLMADRGKNAHLRTMQRMRLDPESIPIKFLPSGIDGAAVQNILSKIEECSPLPAGVFIEGADMLVKDASKPEFVTPFMDAIRKIAEHYHIAIVGSVGAPKQKVGEGYTAQRDKVIGTQVWGRKCETVVTLDYLEGDDTNKRRILSVLPRNGATEKYKMVFDNGRLVVDHEAGKVVETSPEISWFRAQTGYFTVLDLAGILGKGWNAADRRIKDACAKKILRVKPVKSGGSEAKQYHWNEHDTNPLNLCDVDVALNKEAPKIIERQEPEPSQKGESPSRKPKQSEK
jgi:hypothetical protein